MNYCGLEIEVFLYFIWCKYPMDDPFLKDSFINYETWNRLFSPSFNEICMVFAKQNCALQRNHKPLPFLAFCYLWMNPNSSFENFWSKRWSWKVKICIKIWSLDWGRSKVTWHLFKYKVLHKKNLTNSITRGKGDPEFHNCDFWMALLIKKRNFNFTWVKFDKKY